MSDFHSKTLVPGYKVSGLDPNKFYICMAERKAKKNIKAFFGNKYIIIEDWDKDGATYRVQKGKYGRPDYKVGYFEWPHMDQLAIDNAV